MQLPLKLVISLLVCLLSLAQAKAPCGTCTDSQYTSSPWALRPIGNKNVSGSLVADFVIKARPVPSNTACFTSLMSTGLQMLTIVSSPACHSKVTVFINGKLCTSGCGVETVAGNGTYLQISSEGWSAASSVADTRITITGQKECASWDMLFASPDRYSYAFFSKSDGNTAPCCPMGNGSKQPGCKPTVLPLAPPLSPDPFNTSTLNEPSGCYMPLVTSTTPFTIWGQSPSFLGTITQAGSTEQVYALTEANVQYTSHYVGSQSQPIQNYAKFSFSFDFHIQLPGYNADSIFFMVGAAPQPTYYYLMESDGLGLKVVLDVYPDNTALFNKASLILPGNTNGGYDAISPEPLNYYGSEDWHTLRVDYRQAQAPGEGNMWTVYYDGNTTPVINYTQPDSSSWLSTAGPQWVLGARTGGATASMSVRHINLVVSEEA